MSSHVYRQLSFAVRTEDSSSKINSQQSSRAWLVPRQGNVERCEWRPVTISQREGEAAEGEYKQLVLFN